MPAPPPARPRLGSINSTFQLRGSGSPSQAANRKSYAPVGRPRKLFRRTLSMYEHPADVMNATVEKRGSALESVMDVDEAYHLKLANFVPEDKPDSLPRINQDTMVSVLNGDFDAVFERRMVIDCRFEYEYDGGHIDGAITLIIFHCEYSAHRAPLMAKYLRQQDRSFNAARYPRLTFPEVYILDGGYSSFFKIHRLRCYPQSYVEMESRGNERECEIGLNKIRIGQRGKLARAQTYAFGQKRLFKKEQPQGTCQSQSQPDRTSLGGFGVIEEHSSPCRPGASAACASFDMLGASSLTQPTLTSDWELEANPTAPGIMSVTKRTVSY
jgi:M-phase inducer tyrosine phosphatase